MDKWVPHELNENHKHKRFEISSALLRDQNGLVLNRIVTCDEKWILHDNCKRSVQCLDAGKDPQHFPNPKLTAEKYCREIDEMNQKLTGK